MSILIVACVAYANESQEKAERIRLSEEMKNLAKLGHWAPANSKYLDMLDLKKASPSFRDHYTAAQIAAALGNIYETYIRLERAYALEQKSDLKDWMDLLEQTTAPVNIEVKSSYKEDFSLNIARMPMIAEEQKAIKYAQNKIKRDRSFKGMLPFGSYTIADKAFTLGETNYPESSSAFLDVEKIVIKPPPAPSLVQKMGPRVFLGAGYSGAGTPTQMAEKNPTSFGGLGIRAALGWQIQLRFGFDLVAEVDFRNLMTSISKDIVYNEAVGLSEDSLDFSHDTYTGIGLTTGISYPIGKLNVFAGASATQGTAVVQGLDKEHSSLYAETCKPQVENHYIICDERTNVTDSVLVEGVLLSVGPTLGISYDLLSIGENLALGTSTMFGIQSDTSRAYYWGQVGISIYPSRSIKK